MISIKNSFYLIFVTAVIAVGFAVNDAYAQPTCFLQINKSAPQDVIQEFSFTVEGGTPNEFTLADTDDQFVSIFLNDTATIVEDPINGWALSDVTCDDDTGLEITDIQNGILVTCVQPMQSLRQCTFNNVKSVRPIPTISEWGLLATVAGLGLAALFVMLRNRRRAA